MKSHLAYAWYVARHKWFVLVAGLRVGAPLWRLLIHDWSKFTRAEWGPYVRRFFSGNAGNWDKTADPEDFHRAWTHHWHLNSHHWEHWLVFRGDELRPIPIPESLVREMVADWMGAGRAITGRWEVLQWYDQNRERIRITPETRALVESLLGLYG